MQALTPSDELRRSAPAVDRRDGASLRGNTAPASEPASSNSLSTTSFLVPGLPVRDVRFAPGADGLVGAPGGSVVVTQELSDGSLIELQFVPVAGSDAVVGGALQERSDFLAAYGPRVGRWSSAMCLVVGPSCRGRSPNLSWRSYWTVRWGCAEKDGWRPPFCWVSYGPRTRCRSSSRCG